LEIIPFEIIPFIIIHTVIVPKFDICQINDLITKPEKLLGDMTHFIETLYTINDLPAVDVSTQTSVINSKAGPEQTQRRYKYYL
jgi:hypothetical protein